MGHFSDIDALDLDGVGPMTQPYPLVNIMREDVELPCLDTDEVLAAAPHLMSVVFVFHRLSDWTTNSVYYSFHSI